MFPVLRVYLLACLVRGASVSVCVCVFVFVGRVVVPQGGVNNSRDTKEIGKHDCGMHCMSDLGCLAVSLSKICKQHLPPFADLG